MGDIDIQFEIKDFSDEVKKNIAKATERALYASGIIIQKSATDSISGLYNVDNKAVDTGRLRASISFITPEGKKSKNPDVATTKPTDSLSGKSDTDTLVFGSNVEYAVYVHEGTKRKKTSMPARPFLREGVDKAKDEVRDMIERIFKGEI